MSRVAPLQYLFCRAAAGGYFVALPPPGLFIPPEIVFAGTRAECLGFLDDRGAEHDKTVAE